MRIPHYYKNYDKNKYDKFYTRGQCLLDFQLMLNNTLEELSKQITDRPISILDPCCGTKALECADSKYNIEYHLYDIDPIDETITYANFLEYEFNRKFDLIVCNPPFTYSKEFANKCMELSDNVIFISQMKVIPCYEYSFKFIYKSNFRILCNVGIWHYNKNKNNEIIKPNIPSLSKYYKHLHTVTKEMYEKEPDKWLYAISLFETDPRLIERRYYPSGIIEDASIYDVTEDLDHIINKFKELINTNSLKFIFEPNGWIYHRSNAIVKKGQPRTYKMLRTNNKQKLIEIFNENCLKLIILSNLYSRLTLNASNFIAVTNEIFDLMKPYIDLDYSK